MPRLNVPYVTTFVGDYCWMATIWLFAYAVASNDKLNAWTGVACAVYLQLANFAREYVYWIFFRRNFAKCKTDFRILSHPDFWQDVVSTFAFVMAIGYVGCHTGLMHCRFSVKGMGLVDTALTVSLDFWIVNLIKDNTSLRFVHPWMHKKENYWLHKRHHQGGKNTTTIHTYFFNLVDLTLEIGIGPLLGVLGKHYLFGMEPSLHFVSLLFSLWTDVNVHSENPYSQVIGNPLLDWIMKPNLAHNLHHVYQTDPKYMAVYPIHHIASKEGLEKDVELYNKVMQTRVDFRIFID